MSKKTKKISITDVQEMLIDDPRTTISEIIKLIIYKEDKNKLKEVIKNIAYRIISEENSQKLINK